MTTKGPQKPSRPVGRPRKQVAKPSIDDATVDRAFYDAAVHDYASEKKRADRLGRAANVWFATALIVGLTLVIVLLRSIGAHS